MIERINWKCVMVCGVVLFALWSVAAQARWKPEYGAASPDVQAWFKNQHNEQGQWCCDDSDGHAYYGSVTPHPDGSITLDGDHTLPGYMVLKGPNPTGHAVWWFTENYHGERTSYCFAPGTMS